MCQSPPLVDVASQIVGADGPAAGGEAGSCSSALQAEMKHFEHEAFGDEEEEPACCRITQSWANRHLQAHVDSAHADTGGIVIMVGHDHQHYHQH